MKTKRTALRLLLVASVLSLVDPALLAQNAWPQLINISTRGFVGTGNDVLIGGFIIGGTTPVPVLIRGRGPFMQGAPFSVGGTLADPFLQIFSGQRVIAQNDNWQDAQQQEILATGLDPCQPNPGQQNAPPGCAQESAIVVFLPPGGYTAILSGVGQTTGVGLVEVFELTDASSPPNVLGGYSGSITVTQSHCQNPLNEGTITSLATATIGSQGGSLFSGTASFSTGFDTVSVNFIGTVTEEGLLMGSFSTISARGFQSSGLFTGTVVGNSITLNISGRLTVGDTCTVNGTLSGSR
jgi:hypothetical protein